jgi:hypothetical protein
MTSSPLVPLMVPGAVAMIVGFSRLQVTDSCALTREGPFMSAMSARRSDARVVIPIFRI